ncbi:MAG: rhomboid family intramembrane serine protease [Pseudobutyrivibrio sp.]|nr:rhomboid family intramembrane serine protease [Pseudobutyrivibrio sp.]
MKIKIKFNSPVVLSFTIISFVVLLLGLMTGNKITEIAFMTYGRYWTSPLTYVRLFTHVLGHANFQHYIGNMMYLLLIGPLLEEKYGSKAMLEIILITALVTGLINNLLFPDTALCGASGVVFAFIVMASFTSFSDKEIPLTFILVVILYVGQEIFQGIFVTDNISNTAHIVGGLIGSVIGYKLNKKNP